MTEEKAWSLTPETISELRPRIYEHDGIDNGFAAIIMLRAFDLIEGLRLQVKDLEDGRKAWENKAHELQAEVQRLNKLLEKCDDITPGIVHAVSEDSSE